ncbi:hypothetical protein V2J09_016521 [Rumex salicifolius]
MEAVDDSILAPLNSALVLRTISSFHQALCNKQFSLITKAKPLFITPLFFFSAASSANVNQLKLINNNAPDRGIIRQIPDFWHELSKHCVASNTSPLYLVVVEGHLEVVNAILEANPSVVMVVRENENLIALDIAARSGLLFIVRALKKLIQELSLLKIKRVNLHSIWLPKVKTPQ